MNYRIDKKQEEYEFIKETERKTIQEYSRLVEQEKILIAQQAEEKRIKLVMDEIKSSHEREIKTISDIGLETGKLLTINTIIKKLEQLDKLEEAQIIREKFIVKESENMDVLDINEQSMLMFNSSFCNGISMVLLEISFELTSYPQTIREIHMIGHQIMQQILLSNTKSISCTMNKLLL
jgi:hypothetical protein